MQRAAFLQHGARGGCSYKIEDAPRIGVLKEGELFLYSGPDSDSNVDANALPRLSHAGLRTRTPARRSLWHRNAQARNARPRALPHPRS